MTSAMRISTSRVEVGNLYFVALLREELGERIKSARNAAGLSQRELADLIHIKNASDVSRYERGVVEVPSHRIDLIASATSKPRSYFTRDPSEPEPVDEDALRQVVREEMAEVLDLVKAIQARLEQGERRAG